MTDLIACLQLTHPIVQAPMAGVATPAMAAAVANAGGLGSLGLGASRPDEARAMIRETRERTGRAINANLFCHAVRPRDASGEKAWLRRLAPEFERFGARPPADLPPAYASFLEDDAMLAMLLEERPAVVSFHFGLPDAARIAALKEAGIVLLASATSLAEARMAEAAGMDAVVAQGFEAGGHRGVFDENGADECLGTFALTRLLSQRLAIPVIAAGGIMDGAGIAAALSLGAVAAQLGTAFACCEESAADAAYRARLTDGHGGTAMTRVISGRPARCLTNRFTAFGVGIAAAEVAAYPNAYGAGKALNAAARNRGETGFGAWWAGQGAALSRPMGAGALVETLAGELAALR
ncbi:NAD(P)H-dependent flavin oxidoreductase [Zhengella sp. ZM62]|uniref:NAD(P)H-dependent flavin oxidoreductase n=1 Tax=Zhengella sedimenti TaxID=3390035 RepID=UPI0039752C04